MKIEKSPGLDGFTVEFFKFFWTDLKFFILRSINYGYHTGSLSVTQKQGVITVHAYLNLINQDII